MPVVTIDGAPQTFAVGKHLLEVLNRSGADVPQVCYHHQLGPIQTCDTCMVEADGKLVRSCGTLVRPAPEQRPTSGAFPRRQQDVSHSWHPREDAVHVRRGVSGAGANARRCRWNVGGPDLALRRSTRAGGGEGTG